MIFAYLLPGLSLALNRRPGLGILLLALQPTLIGWAVGASVASKNLKRQRRRRRHQRQDWLVN
ncbi:MAG: YqaE/Pmp3 family membrane protein [Hymenobacter sp.]|nr:MAG: YqaE/Pmp3 family membrane protein [Hymenobacter sp.]